MLIDTKQLVSLTALRAAIGDYFEQTRKGNVFYITERGRFVGAIVPVQMVIKDNNNNDIFRKFEDLRARFHATKSSDTRDSTTVIREMRDSRY